MDINLNELERLRKESQRWEAYRAEMANTEKRFAKLAKSFLELGCYKDAAECAIQAEGMRFVCGRMPPPAPKADHPEHALELVGLRGCNSRHGGARKPEPCIYRMRTTDPGCTGCAERNEDQPPEAGG